MLANIRKEIANRFNYEINRRNLSSAKVSSIVDIPDSVIKSYLKGTREISFAEVTTICRGLGINPVRLVYSDSYPKSRLAFRNSAFEAQKLAAAVEDIFLLVKEFLPKPDLPVKKRTYNTKYERYQVIAEAGSQADETRKKYGSPVDFFRAYSLPVIPIAAEDVNFDAFVMNDGENVMVCVNSAKPPSRIWYSLAHEMAHILFDRDIEIQIDTFSPDLCYWTETISKQDVPEFFAYKFAQFYLIPHEAALDMFGSWPDLNLKACQMLINNSVASVDVLVNAIYDMQKSYKDFPSPHARRQEHDEWECRPTGDQLDRMGGYEDYDETEARYDQMDGSRPKKPTYKNIKLALSSLKSSKAANSIYQFLNQERGSIAGLIEKRRDAFSDKIFQHIMEVLRIELR